MRVRSVSLSELNRHVCIYINAIMLVRGIYGGIIYVSYTSFLENSDLIVSRSVLSNP
jgi:hypothetical protein